MKNLTHLTFFFLISFILFVPFSITYTATSIDDIQFMTDGTYQRIVDHYLSEDFSPQ